MKPTIHRLRPLLVALALAGPGLAVGVSQLEGEVAATALDTCISFEELDRILVEKHAMSPAGRDALDHLLQIKVLEKLAREARVQPSPAEIEGMWNRIEAQVIESGQAPNLRTWLRQEHRPEWLFRQSLRLAIVHERLARRALGIAEGRDVSRELQEMWLDQIIEERGTELPSPPWEDGVAGRCGDLAIGADEYLLHLHWLLPHQDLTDACRHLVLVRRMRSRMPDLSQEAIDREVERELGRRRAKVAANPKYQGITYEQIMVARGQLPGTVAADPELQASALTHLWVDRNHGEAGLRRIYAAERAHFDGRFGEAWRCWVIFLNAAVLPNPLNPRSFEEAAAELEKLARGIEDLEDLQRLAGEHSEDPRTRARGGELGWVGRGDERVSEPIRQAVFEAFGSGEPPAARLLGPVRLPDGVILLWVGERREAPGWEEMSALVHLELRRRFTAEVLPEGALSTYLDI